MTAEEPYDERAEDIMEDIGKGITNKEKIEMIADRKEAIKKAKKGDIILCAGKGHENYQEIKGVKSHFDDIEEFRKAYGQF